MKKIVFCLSLSMVLLVSCYSASAQTSSEHAAVQKTVRAIIDADNAGDIAAVSRLYLDDAVWLPPTGPVVAGKVAILPRYRDTFARFTINLDFESAETQVFGDWAFDRGLTRGQLTSRENGATSVINDKYLMILRKGADGKWRIARLMWNPA